LNERHAGIFSLDSICRLSEITRQAYYKHFSYQHQSRGDDELVLEWVKEIRTHQSHLGVHKLYQLLKAHLQQHHIKMGRDALYDLLASENLLVKKKKRKGTITTNSKHWFRKYKNLIAGMQIVRPKQVWVSDITYIQIENGFLYLSLITDAYSRRIMGFCLADNLDAANSMDIPHKESTFFRSKLTTLS
jgi:transposase InsO family protein